MQIFEQILQNIILNNVISLDFYDRLYTGDSPNNSYLRKGLPP